MTDHKKPSKALHIALWTAQVALSASLIWAAIIKLFQPIKTLSLMWPWTGQVPVTMVKFAGFVDLLGAIGLIMPALFHIKPKLTPFAAIGVILLMICASIFHIVRGEASVIGVNVIFAIIAAFIVWGRLEKMPL